jgi:hypothetical protein
MLKVTSKPRREVARWDEPGGYLLTALVVSGMKEGASAIQALKRNRRTCRSGTDAVGFPVVREGGPQADRIRKRQSTDPEHRDGPSRSSEEACVMRVERRGRVICDSLVDQPRKWEESA